VRPVPSTIAAKLARAAELFANRGLDQAKIEDVAEATGVPKATLYYYFTGKEEILAHLLAETLQNTADAVAVALDQPGSGADRLRAVIDAQLAVMAEQPAVCRALISELGRAGRIPEIASAIEAAYYTPVAQVLAEGAADGSLKAVESTSEAVMVIFGAVTITGLHYLVRDEGLPDEAAPRIAALLMHGLAKDPT
jgi:TetR/AcrR family transcriptional regulator